MPSAAEKATYQSEITTLLGQRTTAISNLNSAEAAYASARDTRSQRISELAAIDQQLQDRRVWVSS